MKISTHLARFMRLLLALAVPLTVQAGLEKPDVCHLDQATGTFRLIHVSVAALSAHLNHGDAQPGESVPGMPDYTFNENCRPVALGLPAGCYPSEFNSLLWSGGTGPGNGDFYPTGVFDCSGLPSGHATYVVADNLDDAQAACSSFSALTSYHPQLYLCFGTVVFGG